MRYKLVLCFTRDPCKITYNRDMRAYIFLTSMMSFESCHPFHREGYIP